MCWAKKKNHLFSESLIIFLLKETVNRVLHCTITSQEKVEMLKRHFFSEKLQADFRNMKETIYFLEIKLLSQISIKNIQNFMICQQAFSISDINNIFNVFLCAMSKSFAEAVAKLTQICWRLSYYLIYFHKARTVTFCKQRKDDYISFRF